ncbi:hypothetical protein [Kitasatospora sp. MBT66]|uniref:hypothetical protein n=1 Tax=Kitasatospora sp. MBT66 TaxID=1444769 RepID=UPI0005BE4E06|nr:hypothetical protein [Kitasatospora sp. MBT66]
MSNEPERYTAGEIARSAGWIGVAVITTLAGRGHGLADRRITKLQAAALEREAREKAEADARAKGQKGGAR